MSREQIIKRYEEESWNTVTNGNVYDSCGQYICKFTTSLALEYHRVVLESENEAEWEAKVS